MRNLFTKGSIGFNYGRRNIINGSSVFQFNWSIGKKATKPETAEINNTSILGPFLAGVGVSFLGYFIAVAATRKEAK